MVQSQLRKRISKSKKTKLEDDHRINIGSLSAGKTPRIELFLKSILASLMMKWTMFCEKEKERAPFIANKVSKSEQPVRALDDSVAEVDAGRHTEGYEVVFSGAATKDSGQTTTPLELLLIFTRMGLIKS